MRKRTCIDCGKTFEVFGWKAQTRRCDDCKKKRMRISQYRSMKKRQKVYAQAIKFILASGLEDEFTEWLKNHDIKAGKMLKPDWRRGHIVK